MISLFGAVLFCIRKLVLLKLKAYLRPSCHIYSLCNSEYEWHVNGENPYFILPVQNCWIFPGWYMIEYCVCTEYKNGFAKFIFNYGQENSNSIEIIHPFKSELVSKRLVFLSKRINTIKLIPINRCAKFSIKEVNLIRLNKRFACKKILERLSTIHRSLCGIHIANVKKLFEDEVKSSGSNFATLMYHIYDKFFERSQYPIEYHKWTVLYDKKEVRYLEKVYSELKNYKCIPTISVILPIQSSDIEYIRECVDSVLNQTANNWELCISLDRSLKYSMCEFLEELSQKDTRIKITYSKANATVSEVTNCALEIVTGDYVAFLEQNGTLSLYAICALLDAINKNPGAKLFYSDEDKINSEAQRFDPHFKPDWNPDLFFSHNYIRHLVVIEKVLVKTLGGMRAGYEGNQDYEFLLRCVLMITERQIIHIPKVLYHQCVLKNSIDGRQIKPIDMTESGIKALSCYFRDLKKSVNINQGVLPNTYKITYSTPSPPPLVSLIIPTRDGIEVLKKCVFSILRKTTYKNYEILIVDNQSRMPETIEFLQYIKRYNNIRSISYNRPFNYSAINNYAITQAKGSIVGLINSDVEVISPEWLTEMVSHASRDDIGCVGAKLYFANGQIQHAGVILGIRGIAGHSHKYFFRHENGYCSRLQVIQNYSAVTAACLLVRKNVYLKVGGLNANDLPIAFNDVDFCIKVRDAGYRNLWTPYAELYHHESVSRGEDKSFRIREQSKREIEYMKKKWGTILYSDPAYNPNLSLFNEDYSCMENIDGTLTII